MTTKIYVLCEPDGKIRYVGKTMRSLKHRFAVHLSESRKGKICHRCNWIRSFLKVGILPNIQFIGEVDGNGDKEEIAWIKYFRDEGVDLVNETDGGASPMLGKKHSKEARLKISRSLIGNKYRKGIPNSISMREKIRLSLKGKILSKEQCLLRSVNKKKWWDKQKTLGVNAWRPSQATKTKISIAGLGRKVSDETKQKMSLRMIGNKFGLGTIRSEEIKKKMSLIQKNRFAKERELGIKRYAV